MRRWIVGFLFFVILIAPWRVNAQEQLQLNSLQVDLWPEYDRPSVLVIYRITLPPATPLPASLTFRIPAEAGDPNAVASRQMDGTLTNIPYERTLEGEWGAISFTAVTPESQIEYYDPALQKEGERRHYVYLWPGDYAVEAMTLQVQQPYDSTNMQISPSLGSGRPGTDGLTYYRADIGALKAGQTFEITLDYEKSSETLSAESLQVQPSAPIPSSSGETSALTKYWPWLLGFLGIALIVGGVVWYWQTGKREVEPTKRRRRVAPAGREAPAATSDAAVFCNQCGNRAAPGDRFCRACGTRLRP